MFPRPRPPPIGSTFASRFAQVSRARLVPSVMIALHQRPRRDARLGLATTRASAIAAPDLLLRANRADPHARRLRRHEGCATSHRLDRELGFTIYEWKTRAARCEHQSLKESRASSERPRAPQAAGKAMGAQEWPGDELVCVPDLRRASFAR